jgi:hypothetical protein
MIRSTKVSGVWANVTIVGDSLDGKHIIVRTAAGNLLYRTKRQLREPLPDRSQRGAPWE